MDCKKYFIYVITLLISRFAFSQTFPGFSITPYFNEQVLIFNYYPEVRIHINAPSVTSFNPALPTGIALYALPNGNTIEHTIGKKLKSGDDWHYDIQHIGAQARFLRERITDYNLVTVYLETTQKSWPSWRSKYSNNAQIIKSIVDTIKNIFSEYNPFIILTGHSGGGSFTFGYLNSVTNIPNDVQRISFLDSDYNYDNITYGQKLVDWINASPNHYLSVIAYNDSVALYNGQPVVSPTGGTWYRSRMMATFMANYFSFTTEIDTQFIKYTALNGRVKFILKQNPRREILHTVQVELNGHIQGMVSGTSLEGFGYVYFGQRAYSNLIQSEMSFPKNLIIPPRPPGSMTGSQFMNYVMNMSFEQRENEIFKEISKGNIPDFMRSLKSLTAVWQDNDGISHNVIYQVMPDYLAIGSNEDYCRIPMGPITAQKLANLFGATMPTTKLVDDIYFKAGLKLAPITYTPIGNQNELVPKFIQHNQEIEAQRIASGQPLGTLIGGIKKDVVISNKITDPNRTHHVCIYGWHQLNGVPIQPLTNIHINTYVDYSHGIRLLNSEIYVDSIIMTFAQIVTDPKYYKILSNEIGAMTQPSYLKDSTLPSPPKSWGVKSEGSNSLRLLVKADTSINQYIAFLSKDGIIFSDSIILNSNNLVINGLFKDSLYYIRLKSVNSMGSSVSSEVLAGITNSNYAKIIIVNGFDRASSGNTYDFIRQHASAIFANGHRFESATNEAILDGLFNLENYQMADYILGDESTADETFNNAEQNKVKSFLMNGGKLFVSGSEIAWDLDYKGTVLDKDFINNYLKMKYIADAPNGQSGVFYQAEVLDVAPFYGILPFYFDNGTHGTFDVKWPDVIKGNAGGNGFLKYIGLDTSSGFAGIYYEGIYPGGTNPGKLVAMGFPFETIYPQTTRNQLMEKILNFFSIPSGIELNDDTNIPEGFTLYQNYPNPFNSSTIIKFSIPKSTFVTLKVFDVLGQEVAELVEGTMQPGIYNSEFCIPNSALSSGVYFYKLKTKQFSETKKMIYLR